jgi:N-acetylmuramoyl-L-alanine amidase
MSLGGWAIHESGIQSVAVYVDRKYTAEGNLGGDRPDVAAAYPAFKRDMISTWNIPLDTKLISPGGHELIVRVRAKDGATRDLAVPVIIDVPK